MISEPIRKRLASLHLEDSAQLVRINQLAFDATDPDFLDLCTGCIDSLLQDKSLVPPYSQTPAGTGL